MEHDMSCQLYLQKNKFEATSSNAHLEENSHLQRCMYRCIQSLKELWETSQRMTGDLLSITGICLAFFP